MDNTIQQAVAKDLLRQIGEWTTLYDETEEHDNEFNMDRKDEARVLFEQIEKFIALQVR